MPQQRSALLLALLAIVPIALLAWLGTYLIRDASKRTSATTKAVLTERLTVADHQLTNDLRQLTERLDETVRDHNQEPARVAESLGDHSWVTETWRVDAQGAVIPGISKQTAQPAADGLAVQRSAVLRRVLGGVTVTGGTAVPAAGPALQPFRAVSGVDAPAQDRSRQAMWQTFVKTSGYHLTGQGGMMAVPVSSGWHVTDGDFIYWCVAAQGHICCARLDGKALQAALFARIPSPGLEEFPGLLRLTTASGIPLHTWGRGLPGSEGEPEMQRPCSEPLQQWVLGYTPASEEFPTPYLFPILLAIASGSLLVLALAWLSYREGAREFLIAQQRVTFVNQVSHELKTPLTNIRLYAEMAAQRAESTGDSIAVRQLGVVEAETTRLNRLIQNVLNYARQQRDKLTVQPRQIVLDEVVERAASLWRPLLEGKGFELNLDLHGPPVVSADPDAIEQILGNLLSNVDKYASTGKWVAVRTSVENDMARLVVEDRGPGIPAGRRRAVFEPFERLRSDLTEGVSGTGIGLTISRELAELQGGSLRVCSQYREGARFILLMPIPTT